MIVSLCSGVCPAMYMFVQLLHSIMVTACSNLDIRFRTCTAKHYTLGRLCLNQPSVHWCTNDVLQDCSTECYQLLYDVLWQMCWWVIRQNVRELQDSFSYRHDSRLLGHGRHHSLWLYACCDTSICAIPKELSSQILFCWIWTCRLLHGVLIDLEQAFGCALCKCYD